MKVIPGPLAAEMSGKLGGVVASHNRGGMYFRRRAKPVIVTTDAALLAKARFSAVSEKWSELTVPQREAWTLWGANNPIVDRVGAKITLDGHASFVRCNCLMATLPASMLTLPPTDGPPLGLTSMSLNAVLGTGKVEIVFAATPLVDTVRLKVLACVTTSAARNYVKGQLKLIGISAAAAASPLDIKTLVEARIGTLQVGDYLHVEVCTWDAATGLSGSVWSDSSVITTLP